MERLVRDPSWVHWIVTYRQNDTEKGIDSRKRLDWTVCGWRAEEASRIQPHFLSIPNSCSQAWSTLMSRSPFLYYLSSFESVNTNLLQSWNTFVFRHNHLSIIIIGIIIIQCLSFNFWPGVMIHCVPTTPIIICPWKSTWITMKDRWRTCYSNFWSNSKLKALFSRHFLAGTFCWETYNNKHSFLLCGGRICSKRIIVWFLIGCIEMFFSWPFPTKLLLDFHWSLHSLFFRDGLIPPSCP